MRPTAEHARGGGQEPPIEAMSAGAGGLIAASKPERPPASRKPAAAGLTEEAPFDDVHALEEVGR